MSDDLFSPTRISVAVAFRLILGLLACIAPVPAFAETDAALQARIEYQVQHEPRLDGTDIRVITDDGNVVLTGQVRLLSQKMLYGQIAWQTVGTIDVDNEIRVTPATVVSDQKLEEAIRRLLQKHEQFRSIDAAVKDGIATIHGTFTGAADVLFLKWRIAEIEGVILVLIESQIIAQR